MCHRLPVDLRTWITDELHSTDARLRSSVLGQVPREFWRTALSSPVEGAPSTSTIAGLLFHTTYHHDLAISTAVLDRPPQLADWRSRLGLDGFEPEAGLSEREDDRIVHALDLDALLAYLEAVNTLTEGWAAKLSTYALDSIAPNCRRLEQRAGVRAEQVPWLHSMWDGKPVAWLVRWEALGHPLNHLGELVALRNLLGLSPF